MFWFWTVFILGIVGLLLLDLYVFQRKSHVIRVREALLWSAFWIGLALLFNLGIYFWRGSEDALAYLAGYLIEKSLSVDNLFVFLVIFSYFSISPAYQHKILFWGIVSALVFRGAFIFFGIALVSRLHWMIYLFGAFLIYTGIRLALSKDKKMHPDRNLVLRAARKILPLAKEFHGDKFLVKQAGRWLFTPMFIVLLAIETTDIVFAVDSIPAVMSITLDPMIIYTSNIFAILGLRALFFALAEVMRMFHYLHYGLAVILSFTGVKMLLTDMVHIPTWIALVVVAGVLAISIIFSLLFPPAKTDDAPAVEPDHSENP